MLLPQTVLVTAAILFLQLALIYGAPLPGDSPSPPRSTSTSPSGSPKRLGSPEQPYRPESQQGTIPYQYGQFYHGAEGSSQHQYTGSSSQIPPTVEENLRGVTDRGKSLQRSQSVRLPHHLDQPQFHSLSGQGAFTPHPRHTPETRQLMTYQRSRSDPFHGLPMASDEDMPDLDTDLSLGGPFAHQERPQREEGVSEVERHIQGESSKKQKLGKAVSFKEPQEDKHVIFPPVGQSPPRGSLAPSNPMQLPFSQRRRPSYQTHRPSSRLDRDFQFQHTSAGTSHHQAAGGQDHPAGQSSTAHPAERRNRRINQNPPDDEVNEFFDILKRMKTATDYFQQHGQNIEEMIRKGPLGDDRGPGDDGTDGDAGAGGLAS